MTETLTSEPGEACVHDIKIHQGADRKWSLFFFDSNSAILPLTSYSCAMDIRLTEDDPVALLSLTSSPAAGITITAAAGQIDFAITAAQTAAFKFKRAFYDIKVTSGSGEVKYFFKGEIKLTRRVTR